METSQGGEAKKKQVKTKKGGVAKVKRRRRRRVVYRLLIPTFQGSWPLLELLPVTAQQQLPLWYWPCLPGRPREAASNEAPVPGSQSCCRRAECRRWKPPPWSQLRCGWCAAGSPERNPGSSLGRRLRTPARAHGASADLRQSEICIIAL